MNMNNIISDLSLANGDSKRMTCPSCGSKNTFTVTNNMGSIVWNCYKVSCKISGAKRVHLTSDDIRKSLGFAVQETVAIPFAKPEWLVKDNASIKSFTSKWGLDADSLGLLYDVKENRVVFPVVHENVMVDATGRSLGAKLPKWKRYGSSNKPYTRDTTASGICAVVVEDCVSAAIVGDIDVCVGVSVLGTSLSEGHKQYLTQFDCAIIALDPDALPKTLQFAKELRGYVKSVKVLRLTDDLKYRNEEDIRNLSQMAGE
jgi:ribosomal protein L37AE/L43A